jgi:hypothetical protein
MLSGVYHAGRFPPEMQTVAGFIGPDNQFSASCGAIYVETIVKLRLSFVLRTLIPRVLILEAPYDPL